MKNTSSDKKAIESFLINLQELEGELHSFDRDKLAKLICQCCEFYSPDKELLECGAFKILKTLFSKRIVTREMLDNLKEKA